MLGLKPNKRNKRINQKRKKRIKKKK
jgi:hypothetical protein